MIPVPGFEGFSIGNKSDNSFQLFNLLSLLPGFFDVFPELAERFP